MQLKEKTCPCGNVNYSKRVADEEERAGELIDLERRQSVEVRFGSRTCAC